MSDREIYHAVMDAINARENIEINSGNNEDDDLPFEPRPTRRDVLKVVSTISRYIDDLNEPIAHKMEAILRSFNREARPKKHSKNPKKISKNQQKSVKNSTLCSTKVNYY
jgi:hypothetical protein